MTLTNKLQHYASLSSLAHSNAIRDASGGDLHMAKLYAKAAKSYNDLFSLVVQEAQKARTSAAILARRPNDGGSITDYPCGSFTC